MLTHSTNLGREVTWMMRGDLEYSLMADGDDLKRLYGERPATVCKNVRMRARCKQGGSWSRLCNLPRFAFYQSHPNYSGEVRSCASFA
jgi:hypothetical protein